MEEGLASSSSSEDDADEPPPRAEENLPPLFHEAAGPPPEEETPITERPNPATDFIDAQATTADLARLLTQCDREMYGMPTGDVLGHAGLGSAHFARMFGQLTDQIVEYVRLNQQGATIEATTPGKWRPRAVVFIVGCGTSGRLAFQASRAGNAALKARGHAPMFRHVVAGGDAALFQCVESAEDDGARARDDYDAALAAAGGDAITDAFMIGISAGLSARYVAEMLNRAFDDPKHRFAVAFLGFNPSNQATLLPGVAPVDPTDWMMGKDRPEDVYGPKPIRPASFREVVWRFELDIGGQYCGVGDDDDESTQTMRYRRRLALNPVLGPEAVTGSSRLKGGSATKVILDASIHAAIALACDVKTTEEIGFPIRATRGATALTRDCVCVASRATRAVSQAAQDDDSPLSQLIDAAADALRAKAGVHYLASDSVGVGLTCAIDASEQEPTFGAKKTDVRAYVRGGWQVVTGSMRVPAGVDADLDVSESPGFRAAAGSFGADDLIVVFVTGGEDSASKRSSDSDARDGDGDGDGGSSSTSSSSIVDVVADVVAEKGCRVAVVAVGVKGHDDAIARAETIRATFAAAAETAHRTRRAAERATLATCAIEIDPALGPELGCYEDQSQILSFAPRAVELAVKHVANAVSTGAHVLIGKTFGNRMIDLRVSNAKLFRRAARLIEDLTGVSDVDARVALSRAIHGDPAPAVDDAALDAHVRVATGMRRVVPAATLLATGAPWKDVVDARVAVASGESVRVILTRAGFGGKGGGGEGGASASKKAKTTDAAATSKGAAYQFAF